MKHWSFLFSYLVAPKGAVCLFVCFSSKAMEFFFIIAFTEECPAHCSGVILSS